MINLCLGFFVLLSVFLSYSAAVEAAALENASFGNPISPNISPVRSPYNSGHLSPASASNNSPVSASRTSAPSTMQSKSGGGLGSSGSGGGNLHTFAFQQHQYLGSGGGVGGSPTTFNSGNSISSTKGFSPTSSLSPYRNRPVGFTGRGCGTYELIGWGLGSV